MTTFWSSTPLLQIKLEPGILENNNLLPSIPMRLMESPDADLMDIKLEDLCYTTGPDGQGFVFVEPKACDDHGYDTSNSLSPQSSIAADQDWIDSPSSVESFLSSCSELCKKMYQKENDKPELVLDLDSNIQTKHSSMTVPPPPILQKPPAPSFQPMDTDLELLASTASSVSLQPAEEPETETEEAPKEVLTIQSRPIMPTLLIYPTTNDSTCQR